MSNINSTVLSNSNNDILISFELEFIDPNNTTLSWFNDYYVENAIFEEVYNRYIDHPNAITTITHTKWAALFALNKGDCIKQMLQSLDDGGECVAQEFANEIEDMCNIDIGMILLDSIIADTDNNHWVLGVDKNIILRSPYMSIKDAIVIIDNVISGLHKRHFISGNNSFKIYIKHNEITIDKFNWFKVKVLYEPKSIIQQLSSIPKEMRKELIKRLYNNVNEIEARDTIRGVLGNIKATDFKYHNNIGIFSITDSERYISDKDKTISWFTRILLLVIVATNSKYNKKEFIDAVKKLLNAVS